VTALKANGAPVLYASIGMPVSGAWVARIVVDADEALSGAVVLESDAGLELHGFARRSGETHGRVEALIVAGAGGLATELDGRYYVGAPVQTILGDLLREAGETLSTTSDSAALGSYLQKWARGAGRAGRQIAELLGPLDVSWRVLDDGSIWIGTDTWPAADLDYEITSEHPGDDRIAIADEALGLRPGMTLEGRRVSYVQHHVAPDSIRTEAYFDAA
jgi:hypothetical protein